METTRDRVKRMRMGDEIDKSGEPSPEEYRLMDDEGDGGMNSVKGKG